jgi:tetratricopeptide (TPR) repeat protein
MTGTGDEDAESHLRAAIRANPRFAPAYDALAALLSGQRSKLDQAHMMELQAIALDPGNLHYRLNTAHVLLEQEQFDAAAQVLEAAKTLARNPLEADVVERMLRQVDEGRKQAETIQRQEAEASAQMSIAAAAPAMGVENGVKPMGLPEKPKHPTEKPHGPDLSLTGVIRGVHCNVPGTIELRVVSDRKTVALYNNDAYSIDYRALDFTPKEAIQPCQNLEGKKARVHYFATADKTVDGQITIIALWK